MGQRSVTAALRPALLDELEKHEGWNPEASAADGVELEGTLRADAAWSVFGVSLNLAIDRIRIAGRWRQTAGGARIAVGGTEARSLAAEWCAGRQLRLHAALRLPTTYLNPGVRDERRALALQGTAVVGSVKSGLLVQVTARGSWMAEAAARIRQLVRRSIEQTVGVWSRRSAGIVTAILIGDRAGLEPDVERRLQEAGTYHVIAISGGNIAILAGAVFLVLAACGVRGPRSALIPIAILIAYAVVVGRAPSVIRATAMAVTYLFARVLDHRSPPLNAIALSLLFILCATPLAIFDVGLALTFGATIGILVGARPLAERLSDRRWLRPIAALVAVSIAAEAIVLPIGAYAFGRITAAGPMMNVLAVPLMAVAQIAGLVAVIMAALPQADWMWGLGGQLSRAVGYIAHLAAAGLVERYARAGSRTLAEPPAAAPTAPGACAVFFGAHDMGRRARYCLAPRVGGRCDPAAGARGGRGGGCRGVLVSVGCELASRVR